MEEKRVTSDCVVDLVRYRQRTIPVPGREGREACRCVDDLAKSGVQVSGARKETKRLVGAHSSQPPARAPLTFGLPALLRHGLGQTRLD